MAPVCYNWLKRIFDRIKTQMCEPDLGLTGLLAMGFTLVGSSNASFKGFTSSALSGELLYQIRDSDCGYVLTDERCSRTVLEVKDTCSLKVGNFHWVRFLRKGRGTVW